MNMTHLESRPMEGHPFEYFFHIDVKGRIHDPSNAQTLHGLASMCTYFKIWEIIRPARNSDGRHVLYSLS